MTHIPLSSNTPPQAEEGISTSPSLLDTMSINADMFPLVILYRVVFESDGGLILSQKTLVEPSGLILRSFKVHLIHIILVSQCAKALNSASVLDRTTSCFLLLHVMRFLAKNVQYPVVDLRSKVAIWVCI